MGDVPRNRTNKSRQAIKCKAHWHSGKPCNRWAMEGQLVCRRHGGMAPQNLKAAQRLLSEQKAAGVLARLGIVAPPVTNALEELAKIAGQCVAWKDVMGRKVGELAEDDWRYEGREAGEMVRAELLLWERALDRCITALTAMARLNLDERLVVIEEKKAAKVLAALSESIGDASLDADTAELVRIGFARRLRAITSKSG